MCRHRWGLLRACAASAGILTATVANAAALDDAIPFDIPAQSLDTALIAFSRQAQIQVISSTSAVERKSAPVVRGVRTPRSSLSALLRDSGLTFVISSPSTVTIVSSVADPALDRPRLSRAAVATRAGSAPPSVPPLVEQVSLASPPDVQEVVVTASRVVRTGFTSPTPTTVLGSADMQLRAPVNVIEALNDLPAFRPTATNTANNQAAGSRGQSFVDLRGLGTARTLLLVNGRRQTPTTPSGLVDLTFIPTIMIERTEVVTGGASADWGSDAVAGVVNLILRRDLQGVMADVGFGETDKGDDQTYRASLAVGGRFAGGRGRAILGFDYSNNKGAGDAYTREWGREERGLVSNAQWQTNGQPALIYARGVHNSTMNRGGIFTAGPLKGTAFGAGGVPYAFDYGTVYGSQMVGGEGYGNTLGEGIPLRIPVKRFTSYGHVEYEFSHRLKAFVDASYGVSSNAAPGAPHRDQGSIIVRSDNAFLPAALRAQLATGGAATANFGRNSTDLGFMIYSNNNQTYSFTGGFEGELGGSWRWDGYVQHGANDYTQKIYGNRVEANWNRAIDAVVNPANGQIVCRSTLTDPGNGCQPFNLFGIGAFSPQAKAYVLSTARYQQTTRQTSAALNLKGDVFSTWAGPVSVATGLEYRKQSVDAVSDAISMARGFRIGNAQPLKGEVQVTEGYAEAVVPLLVDAPFAKSFEVNGAFRYTDYSTSGGVNTWKVGASWAVNRQVRFRLTQSRDIRAPNLLELYTAGTSGQATIRNPANGEQLQTRVETTGNTELKPEKADTFTAGFVLQPSFAPRLRFSVDYYNIDIVGQIATIPNQTLVDRCFAGATELCRYITRTDTGRITVVTNPLLNLNRFQTRGLDFEVAYTTPLAALWRPAPGDVSLRVLANHVMDLITVDNAGAVDRAGEVAGAGTPYWLVATTLGYSVNRLTLSAQWRWVSSGTIESTAVPGTATGRNVNRVDSRLYTNLSFQYDVMRRDNRFVQLYLAVNNVFDVQPPFPVGFAVGSSGIYYDTVGRDYRGGVRIRY